jgi:hypothetical protein
METNMANRMRMREVVVGVGFLLASVCLGGMESRGQQAVVIQVKDQSGAPVPGAQVRVAPVPENAPEKMETDSKGELKLQMKPGVHALIVQLEGFQTSHTQIDVKGIGEAQTFPLVLKVGATRSHMVSPEAAKEDKGVVKLTVEPFTVTFAIGAEELKALPRKTVVMRNPHANADETYEGVLLADLLTKYGAALGKELHGAALGNYIVATGADGYKAVFSLAEADPSFHPGDVLLADTMDGKALDARSAPFKLVVTEDKRPARGVRNLVAIEVKAAQ